VALRGGGSETLRKLGPVLQRGDRLLLWRCAKRGATGGRAGAASRKHGTSFGPQIRAWQAIPVWHTVCATLCTTH